MCSLKIKSKIAHLCGALLTISCSAYSNAATVQVLQPVAHDESPPLSEMYDNDQPAMNASILQNLNLPNPLNLANDAQSDAALAAPKLQVGPALSLGATVSINKIGIGKGLGTFKSFFPMPEPTGAVGDTQYVQTADTNYAVFNKSTGGLVKTIDKHSLWNGFANQECATGGYPVFVSIKYDQIAKRWVFAQAALHIDPTTNALSKFTECIAVSKTSDALGVYNRYAFTLDNYNYSGKLGLWPHSYYMTFLMVDPTTLQIKGPKVCALERDKMLAGSSARMICKQLGTTGALQLVPADLEGTVLPPSTAPEYIFGTTLTGMNDKVMLYRYKTTWGTTPTLAIVGSPIDLGVSAFTHACITTPQPYNCIPQKNGTPLAISFLVNNGIMNRVGYRQFPAVGSTPTYGTIVANHSITGPSNQPSAIRWYQFKVTSTYLPTKVQQGTYAPNGSSYFNASIAMDKVGNIALGYNVSSPTMFPSVAITGRTKADPVNTLRTPMTVVTGAGALTSASSQPPLWGTNSFLAIDPIDNCSFWYTTEYLTATGTDWSTRIAKFKLPGCT